MPTNNHRLTRQQARKLIEDLKNFRRGSNGPFRKLPDGFIFPVQVIRNLINHPDAVNFVIQLGWKVSGPGASQGSMTPVLFVTDSNHSALAEIPFPLSSSAMDSVSFARTSSLVPESLPEDDSAGGFINEGRPFPPPTISTEQ